MMIFGAFSFFTGMMYLSLGAFPIVGFLAIGAVGLWIAFKLCFKYQRQWTRVRVTADHVRVDHVNPKGHASNIELPAAFTRVELKEPLTVHSWLTLAHKREAYVIGRFLTIEERASLADAIRAAQRDARMERFADPV